MRDFNREFKPYYDRFMADYKSLLRIPSVLDEFNPNNVDAPFGLNIRAALDKMLEIGERDGFKTVNVDNYSGFIEYGEGDKVLLILGHLDVVPATGKWTNHPFEPTIVGDRIYARGSIDDKGPLIACYYALKRLKDNDFKPNMKIRFFFGCDEETGSRGLHKYYQKYGECDYGFSPDADFPVIYAEKGISKETITGATKDSALVSFRSGTVSNVVPDIATAVIKDLNLEKEFKEYLLSNNLKGEVNGNEYKVYGLAAHGSTPEIGINAALHLTRFLSKYIDNEFLDLCGNYFFNDFYGEKIGIDHLDNEMGKVSNNVAVFDYSDSKYSIITNIRYPKGFDFDEKMNILRTFLKKFNAELRVDSNSPYHYVPKYSHLVQALLKAYRDNTGDNSEPISIGGGTYARDFKNAVAFGNVFPGEQVDMHMPDEFANISSLIKGSFIYEDAIKNICD